MLPPSQFAKQLLKEAEETPFFLDTLRHAAWKIISVGGDTPTWDDLQRQRALVPLVVEEGGEDTIGGRNPGHSLLFAMRRAITARRICADGLMEAFVTHRG